MDKGKYIKKIEKYRDDLITNDENVDEILKYTQLLFFLKMEESTAYFNAMMGDVNVEDLVGGVK